LKVPKIPTSAERAEGLLFELTQLVVGESAPPLIGEDSDGKEFCLSNYKGKVVVVLFSADWCVPCKKLYPELRELQKKFDEKDFAVVSVMADREVKTVRDAITKGDITWRAVWDGEGGPIHSKWNITKLPTVYVFDERGVVHSRDLADAESLVAALVKAKQPDRKDVPKKDEPKAKPLSSPQNMSSLDR
jgi:thiol-disulfide isomerase/thioredoxin